jgi:hypothetical protein
MEAKKAEEEKAAAKVNGEVACFIFIFLATVLVLLLC